MTLPITERALKESQKTRIQPQLVLEIEGVSTLFGALEILRLIRIGDTGLVIGNDWRIGGLSPAEDQADIIQIDAGGTRIDQQLQPDKGSVSSVTSVQVALTDRNLIATRLISPGVVIDDILGAKATLWMGFKDTSFKEDYVPIISGIIDDVESGAGTVKLNIAHPEQLKRQKLFTPIDVELANDIDSTQTTIDLVDASDLPVPQLGPNGLVDTAIKFYIRVEDEIIRYTGRTGNQLTGCTRASLGTAAVAHAQSGSDPLMGKSLVGLTDMALYCALKLMLSGKNGPYKSGQAITRYLHPTPLTTVANSIFFEGVDLNRDWGVTEGDYVTITGAPDGANNCVAKTILEIHTVDGGSYAIIDDVSFVEQSATGAVIAFRSQFDTLGYGLAMTPDQVDVNEHIFWHNFQLAAYSYRFDITDTITGKDFLDKEIYLPIGAFSLPRQGRCSMGYHVGPVIRDTLKVLSRDNIKDPDKIKLRRTLNRNFYNAVVYQFDKQPLTGGYVSGSLNVSQESRNQIRVGNYPLVITSSGMRRALDGVSISARIASRYLGRYKYAAEFFEAVGLLFRDGYALEPGDVVMLDPTDLKISNTEDGDRNKRPKVFSVINKSMDLKTGDVKLAITDTNFDETERYGSVSPSSLIVSGTTLSLIIQDSYGSLYPGNEARKWEDYLGLPIIVHSPDWSYAHEVTLLEIDAGNRYKLNLDPATPLPSPPAAGYIIDVGTYPNNTDAAANGRYKAAHAFMGATVAIVSAADSTHFTVAPADIGKFRVDSLIRVHNADYSEDSGELFVDAIVGNTITTSGPMGFTPTADHVVEGMDMPDAGKTYRIF
jgi:hypothetical protein